MDFLPLYQIQPYRSNVSQALKLINLYPNSFPNCIILTDKHWTIISVKPRSTTVHPCSTTVHPCSTTVHPCSTTVHPCSTTVRPCSTTVRPCSTTVRPCSTTVRPCSATEHPCPTTVHPCSTDGRYRQCQDFCVNHGYQKSCCRMNFFDPLATARSVLTVELIEIAGNTKN